MYTSWYVVVINKCFIRFELQLAICYCYCYYFSSATIRSRRLKSFDRDRRAEGFSAYILLAVDAGNLSALVLLQLCFQSSMTDNLKLPTVWVELWF